MSGPNTPIELFEANKHEFEIFIGSVIAFFSKHPTFTKQPVGPIHTIKSRLKTNSSIESKIQRKSSKDTEISNENFFTIFSDLAGVRILLLHHEHFKTVHNALTSERINTHDWFFREEPKAYSWDIEYSQGFKDIGIKTQVSDSFYTSVHYLVTPRLNSHICCEIQVRTLFEEVWGEVSHQINYPTECMIQSCKDQLKVLARLSSTGSRLVDSIFSTMKEHHKSGDDR